jgi:hypothetical protein
MAQAVSAFRLALCREIVIRRAVVKPERRQSLWIVPGTFASRRESR